MSSMQSHLEGQLELSLNPEYCEVVNESSQHSGPASESHFKSLLMKLIDRHRFINKLFVDELKLIHAMAMHTYTPKEWEKRQAAPDSPECSSKS